MQRSESDANLTEIWQLIQQGDIKRAEVTIARWLPAARKSTALADLYLARAKCKLLSDRPQEALEDWQLALEKNAAIAQVPDALELRADTHFALFEMSSVGFAGNEDSRNSAQLYRQLIAEHPQGANRAWWHYQLGRVLLSANQIEEAIAHFKQAGHMPSQRNTVRAYSGERLAYIAYYEKRNLTEALGYMERALSEYPQQASREWRVEILLLKARVSFELHRWAQARQCIEDAIQSLDPQSSHRPTTLFSAAEILLKIPEQVDRAISLLEELLHTSKRPPGIDVGWARAQELLGEAYLQVERYPDAALAFRQALHHNPYSPWSSALRYQLACAYYQSGEYDHACECAAQLIEVERNEGGEISDYRIFDLLGNAHFALGRYEEARIAYSQALKLTSPHSKENASIRRYHDFAQSRIAG